MKKLLSIILLSIVGFGMFFMQVSAASLNTNNLSGDANTGNTKGRAEYVDNVKGWFNVDFFGGSKTGEAGVEGLTVTVSRDLKNVFIALAIVYLFVLVLRLFFGQGSEDDLKKWRLGILWTTIGIVLMQVSFVAFTTIYNQTVGAKTADALTVAVLNPLIHLLEVVISFLFISVAIMAFYRIITGGGNDDGYKKGVSTIINAIIGFLLVKISGALVDSIYGGKMDCSVMITNDCSVSTNPNLTATTKIIASLIQYITGFVSIITLILIVYAGFMILTSSGDDSKVKKGKSVIKFIIIGMVMIASSVLIFHFITGRDFSGIIGKYN